ncbi:MAG: hypothetical protein ACI8S6_001652 [Myxococcota bacterium]|jgi:hypothetical protein
MLTDRSPLPARLLGYLDERFPPGPYTVLVALFFGSAVLVARDLAGASTLPAPEAWLGAAVVWLVFFHLRIFDEHKDHADDAVAHPERLLSRGVVTLTLLARLAGAAILVQLVLSAIIGPAALIAWAATLAFTVLMRFEFGVGGWLGRHLIVYAVTHNPVVGLLAVYGWACAGVPFHTSMIAYITAASLGSLAFELGRKINLPEEEIDGVDSYSSVLGRGRAGALLAVTLLASAAAASASVLLVAEGWGRLVGMALVLIGLVAGLAGARSGKRAKSVELGSSVALLASLLAMGLAALG